MPDVVDVPGVVPAERCLAPVVVPGQDGEALGEGGVAGGPAGVQGLGPVAEDEGRILASQAIRLAASGESGVPSVNIAGPAPGLPCRVVSGIWMMTKG